MEKGNLDDVPLTNGDVCLEICATQKLKASSGDSRKKCFTINILLSIHWGFFSTESDLTRLNMIIWNTIRNKKKELGRGAEAFGGFWTLLLEWISLMGQGRNENFFKLRLIYNILNNISIQHCLQIMVGEPQLPCVPHVQSSIKAKQKTSWN